MTRLGVVLLLAISVSVSLLASPGQRAPLLFGEGDRWLLVNVRTHQATPVSFPVSKIDNVAVSADGKGFVLIAPDANHGWAVWIWNHGDASAKVLFADGGRYSDPAFDPTGGWIYFSHTSTGLRPHIRGNYAQIFRAPLNGSRLEQITDEDGCHFGAAIVRGDLHYVHSSCSTSSWVQRRSKSGGTSNEVSALGIIDEMAVSPSGHSFLYVLNEPDSVTLWRLRLGEPATILLRQRRTMQRMRPAFGRDDGEVIYQDAGAVWLLKDGAKRAIATIAAQGGRT